jgi:phenylacetate-CoA ligase
VPSLLTRIYDTMPSPVQHALCTIEGYRVHRGRFGRQFDIALREAAHRTWMTTNDLLAYRDQRLDFFVAEAASSTFYREQRLFTGCQPSIEDLPILEKPTVQENVTRIARRDVDSPHTSHTSGSTGAGLRFPVTDAALRQQWATWWRYRQWHGLHFGIWCGYFGGRSVVPSALKKPPFWRYNAAGRQVLFSAYHLRHDTWRDYVGEMRRRRLVWLHGYPSVLALLAGYLLESDVSLGYDVRWITVGAENLLPFQSEAIERAFGVRPRQHYGMAEAVANASECPSGRLHIDEDFSFVEFVPREHGSGYRVVGTNFTNPAFPLLRYDAGDIAHISGQTCDCGRSGRIIDRIDGRCEDYVVLPDGALIGRLDHIFKDQVRVKQAQIYQPDRRHVVLKVVRRNDFTVHDEASLLREARLRLGTEVTIDIDYVDDLFRTASGKLRFVVSDVAVTRVGCANRSGLTEGIPSSLNP